MSFDFVILATSGALPLSLAVLSRALLCTQHLVQPSVSTSLFALSACMCIHLAWCEMHEGTIHRN